MSKHLLYWWLMVCLQVLGAALAYHFGVYNLIIKADYTKITIGILAIHVIATLITGYLTWRKKLNTDALWYIAETQLSLGMIGTLVGFIIMLTAAFGHNDAATLDSIKASIASIGNGMGIAIRATLVGLTSGVILKAQVLNLEKSCETQ